MKKSFLSIFLSLLIILIPIKVNAEEIDNLEQEIVSLQKDQPAPFSGVLLTPLAAAKINTDKKYSLLENELKLDYELKKQAAELNLKLSNLQSEYDSLKESTESIIQIKSEEISRLQEIASNNSTDLLPLWVSLGTIAGILLSLGVFYAAVEVTK